MSDGSLAVSGLCRCPTDPVRVKGATRRQIHTRYR